MKKKPAVCDCGRPGYRKKHGDWICLNCDQIEHECWQKVMVKTTDQPKHYETKRIN